MPLVATLAGDRVVSTDMEDDAWESLKKRYRGGEPLLMSCGQPGVAKVSSRGLKYFAHKAGVDCNMHEGGETPEHLELKSFLAEAARTAGWEAVLECPSASRDWIADVMVSKEDRRIALEVQWSRQSSADFMRRQLRYEKDGVECIWFVAPKNTDNAADVPSHTVGGESGAWHIGLITSLDRYDRTGVPFGEAVGHILAGDYRLIIEPYIQAYSVETAMLKCWRDACGKWFTLWRLDSLQVKTRCGLEGTIGGVYNLESRMFLQDRIERLISDQLIPLLEHEHVDLPRAAKLSMRTSKTAEKTYLAYCCPHCGVLSGDAPITYGGTRWRPYVVHRRLSLPLRLDARGLRHLCIDRGKGQCSQDREPAVGPVFPDGETSSVEFNIDLLVEGLKRLPRKGEGFAAGRRSKTNSSRGTIGMSEVLNRMTGRN
jgi:hypothetical protein